MVAAIPPDTPQTPQPPTPPPPSSPGSASVTVERTVTTTTGSDAGPPPQTPQPPAPPNGARAAGPVGSPGPTAGDGRVTVNIVHEQSVGTPTVDMIRPESVFQIQLGISTVEVDGETVVHDALRDANVGLNASGSFIWSCIAPQISFADLLKRIREAHASLPPASDRMVAEFLADLIDRGVLAASWDGKS